MLLLLLLLLVCFSSSTTELMTNQVGGTWVVLLPFLEGIPEAQALMTRRLCFVQELQGLRTGDVGRGF